MSYIKEHRKRKIKELPTKKFNCPEIEEILPNLQMLNLDEENKKVFVIDKFNKFYILHVDSSSKKFFIKLPIEFFTKENAQRIDDYASIAFAKKIEDCERGLDTLNLSTSKEFYEDLYKTLKRRLLQHVREYRRLLREQAKQIQL